MTPTTSATRITCEGVFNLRDLGGHRTSEGLTVRPRSVYRADGLHRIPAVEITTLAHLSLRTVIDLRTHAEVGLGRYAGPDVDVVHLPMLQSTWDAAALASETGDPVTFLTRRYLEMTETGAGAIARAMNILADDSALPLVFHCSAGKDRTGVLAALLLAALGVPDDDIAADYAESATAMEDLVAFLVATRPEAAEEMARQPAVFLACPPAAMHGFLDELRRRFGSVETYLHEAGVGLSTLAALRQNLLAS